MQVQGHFCPEQPVLKEILFLSICCKFAFAEFISCKEHSSLATVIFVNFSVHHEFLYEFLKFNFLKRKKKQIQTLSSFGPALSDQICTTFKAHHTVRNKLPAFQILKMHNLHILVPINLKFSLKIHKLNFLSFELIL